MQKGTDLPRNRLSRLAPPISDRLALTVTGQYRMVGNESARSRFGKLSFLMRSFFAAVNA